MAGAFSGRPVKPICGTAHQTREGLCLLRPLDITEPRTAPGMWCPLLTPKSSVSFFLTAKVIDTHGKSKQTSSNTEKLNKTGIFENVTTTSTLINPTESFLHFLKPCPNSTLELCLSVTHILKAGYVLSLCTRSHLTS
jgi:hypothetical protein